MQKIIIKSIASKEMRISGYASVFNNIDKQGDIILNGAFPDSISSKASSIRLLWQHNPSYPIGVIKNLTQDSYGLFVEAAINLSTSKGSEVKSLLEQGALDSFSIGFIPQESSVNQEGHREIKKLDLIEVSIVTFPANPYAQISNICTKKNYLEMIEANLDNLIHKIQLL